MTTRHVSLDLDDADTFFVLTEALGEFADSQRDQAEHDPDSSENRIRWADIADAIRNRIENA